MTTPSGTSGFARLLAYFGQGAPGYAVLLFFSLTAITGSMFVLSARTSEAQITLFKSLGVVAQDLFAASKVLALAERAGRGVMVDF